MERCYALIERCRGCRTPETRLDFVLQMDPMPLAGEFCKTAQEAAAAQVFPLTWVRCTQCGLVQVHEDIPDTDLFSVYNYSSSTVPGLVRHFMAYAELLSRRYSRDTAVRFLEIGCNDGVLLNQLPAHWRKTGVDPSDVAARSAAVSKSYELLNAPFTTALVREAGIESSIDVISGSNCLAHISDLHDVFAAAALALRPGGHFWIEVHDLHALLAGHQWDTIYHEHKVEWSQTALCRCLSLHGFEPVRTDLLPVHGGSIRSVFRKAIQRPSTPEAESEREPGLASLKKAYESRYATPAAKILSDFSELGQRIAAYGAAGRANVYLNQMSRLRFAYIVDESPLRVDKYIPRVGTPVVSPALLVEQPVVACLITAWNYQDDIIRKNPGHTGQWLTAFGQ